jgi:hypothetical protein
MSSQRILKSLEQSYVKKEHYDHFLAPICVSFANMLNTLSEYRVELSSTIENDNNVVFQIDEEQLTFYFLFYEDHIEFAFDDFDNYGTIQWPDFHKKSENKSLLCKMMSGRNFPKKLSNICDSFIIHNI